MSGLLKNFFTAKTKPAAPAPVASAAAQSAPQQAPASGYSSLNSGSASILVGGQAAPVKKEEFSALQNVSKDVGYGSTEYFQRLFKLTDIIDRSKVSLRYV